MIGRIVSADTTTAATAIADAEAELADERDADHEQAGDREHHDQAGGDDGRAGGRGGLRRRVAAAVARGDLLAVAADDQQRVVDARAEAEHRSRSPTRTTAGPSGVGERSRAGSGPTITPSSAPNSVAAIATRERNSSVSRTIAIADADQLADRRLLLGARSRSACRARRPRRRSARPSRPAASSASPSSFLISLGSSV